ncbi:MAG: hypothetical protein K8H88_28985, partial [Sandaracinaceae bacterium]|nr:hypothetical protein [Sandaracinaceae bacterium]
MQLMRITAVSPDLVTGSVPIDDLVAGTGTVAAKDSIRFRLAKMRQDAVLLAATTASSVYESLGVSREGFSEARELLREEIRAFDRSPTEPLPAERLPDGSMTSAHEITLYAATRNPPEQLPASYWSALLRYDPTPQTIDLGWEPAWAWLPDSAGNVPPGYTYGSETSASTDPPLVSGTRTLASVLDEVVARGPTAVARLCPTGTCGTQALGRAREAIVGALAAFAANPTTQAGSFPSSLYETADYVGRARVCWLHSTYWDDALIRLTGVVPSDVRVVVGRDGLECAVRGTIDGTPCTSATLSALTPNTVPNTPDSFWVYDLQQRVSDRPNSGLVSLFLVRKRPSTEAAPGNYEELTGWVLPAITSGNLGYRYCQGAVIAPGLDRQAAALIQPRTEPPYRPAESCAGLPSDMRIPLENELTDDGNGIESSWQHYLRLAQTAANEADLLGEDLVRTGMEMDARAEAASDELSRLCGVSINLTSIASAIAADTSPASMPAMGGACASPYVLRGDQCVRDPILYALQRANAGDDYARLASCVGTDTVAWASLGNTPVCAWDANGSAPGGLCDGATPDMPCPIASSTGTNCGSMARPAGATPVNVPDFVGIFARPAEPEPDPPNPNDLPCAALSRARHASGSLTLEEFARLHQFLTHDNISDLAQQVTWEALVGDYSTVSFANATVFRTGSMSQPPSITSLWPMGPAPTLQTATGNVSACPTGAASASDPLNYTGPLFCLQNVASVTGNDGRLARARMNDLLARAVLAVRIFSGNGLGQTILPYYNDNWASCYYAAPSTFSWRRLGTSNGWCSSTGDFLVDHSTSDTAGANTRAVPDYGSRSCFVGTSDSAIPTACPSTFPGIPSGQGTACIVGGLPSIPAEAEWSLCPYDSPSCAEIFDEAFDCDDGTGLPAGQWPNWDHNLPLVLRPADAGLTRENGYVAAAALWDRRGPLRNLVLRSRQRTPEELLAPLESVDSDIRVDDLTNYYQSWQDRGFGAYVRHPEGDYIAATEDPALRLLAEGNRAFIGRNGLTYSDLLNGLELACVASRFALPPEFPQCQAPGPTQSLTDVFRTEDYLRCQANVISQRGSDTMISGLPKRVVDALRDSTAGSGGAGEFDAQVAEIRAGLMELSTTRETLATDLRSFSARIRSLRSVVAVNERSREIEELMVASRTAERLTQCVTALATIASTFDPAGSAGKAAAAVATCANSYTQNVIDSHVQRLREANLDEELIQQFATFDGDLASYSGAFTQRSIELRAAIERINAALARLRSTQNQARRALARALLLESDGAGAHFRLDTTYRARYSTQLTRYRNAHRRAVRSAYIARIALEQRLGMPLADIEDDLYADEAPREWVDEICTLPSIDYDTLGQEIGEGAVPADYSGTYVGDYVRRLENVFESYSFVHPFREGTDTAVISLRDDVFRTRAPCESETPSLLYHGGSFATLAGEGRPGWQLLGCNATLVTGQLNRSCVDATALEATTGMGMDQLPEMPTSVVGADFGRPAPYRLTFGETAAATAGARLEQSLELPRGRYRVSWWARRGPSNTIQPSAAVVLW